MSRAEQALHQRPSPGLRARPRDRAELGEPAVDLADRQRGDLGRRRQVPQARPADPDLALAHLAGQVGGAGLDLARITLGGERAATAASSATLARRPEVAVTAAEVAARSANSTVPSSLRVRQLVATVGLVWRDLLDGVYATGVWERLRRRRPRRP